MGVIFIFNTSSSEDYIHAKSDTRSLTGGEQEIVQEENKIFASIVNEHNVMKQTKQMEKHQGHTQVDLDERSIASNTLTKFEKHQCGHEKKHNRNCFRYKRYYLK